MDVSRQLEKFAAEICKSYPLLQLQAETACVITKHMSTFHPKFWAENETNEKTGLVLYIAVKVISDKMRMTLDNWQE